MADPSVVQKVLDRIDEANRTNGAYVLSTSRSALRGAVSSALDAGITGPDIVGIATDPRKLGGGKELGSDAVASLNTVVAVVKSNKASSAKATSSADAERKAGFSTTVPATAGSGSSGPTSFVDALLKSGYYPVPGKEGLYFNPTTGDSFNANALNGAGNGNALGYADLAERQREYDQTRLDTQARNAVTDKQWQQTYDEGVSQFNRKFDRENFNSDRSFNQAQDQFATNFAQQQANLEFQAAQEKSRFGMEIASAGLAESRFNRQQSLAELQNEQQILTRPSDIVARAFEARGGTSPLNRVTHADLINTGRQTVAQQRAESAAYLDQLRGLLAAYPTPRLVTPTNTVPKLAPPPGTPAPPTAPTYNTTPDYLLSQGVPSRFVPGTAEYNAAHAAVVAPAAPAESAPPPPRLQQPQYLGEPIPQMASGGETQSNVIVAGDSKNGKPNEEYVIDLPNDGGLMVVPKDRVVGKRKRMADVPHMADGGYVPTNQQDLVDTARMSAPPAVTDLLGGRSISRFRPAERGISPRRIGFMTPSEQEMLNSYLGVVDNTTLADELAGVKPLFDNSVAQPRTRFVNTY